MFYIKRILRGLGLSKEIERKVTILKTDKEMLTTLLEHGYHKKDIATKLEEYYEVEYIDVLDTKIDIDFVKEFDFNVLKAKNFIPIAFDQVSQTYTFALPEMLEEDIQNTIRKECYKKNPYSKMAFCFAFSFEIEQKLEELEKKLSNSYEASESKSATDWVDAILEKGIHLKASDIHIEPKETGLQVRYRVDGILMAKEHYNYEKDFIFNLVTRIKVISNLDITEKRKPQDGRIDDFKVNGNYYDFRVSTISTKHGEKIVMRIFNKFDTILSFEELGFLEVEEMKIKQMLNSKHGVLFLSGATGSGKTTTLYTMIQEIESDDINIYTIEDPIEKTMNSINQIQIDIQAGIDYPSSLKALLRQDPDVIVVGEIRDRETAELVIKLALTGHLVLATIHSNSAVETISRLYDMGVEPYLLSSAALGFSAQQLARKLCPHCKEKKELDTVERIWLENMLEKNGLSPSEETEFYSAKGCPKCNHIGYKGRFAIAETIVIDDELREEIAKKTETKRILKLACTKGFSPLFAGAYEKAKNGETSIKELMRVL